jgi:exosome complex RNA-binding protein Rrp42 (RNase PH superfamily)
MNMKKIALIVGCAALIGAFSITAPSPSWAAECNEQCQVEKAAKKAAKKVKKAEKKGSQAIAAHELKKAANKAGKEVKKLLK